MSVINTMLKDLESRGAACDKSDNAILGGLSANNEVNREKKTAGNNYLVSLLSVFSFLVVITAIYYFSPFKLVSTVDKGISPVASKTIASKDKYQGISNTALNENHESDATESVAVLSTSETPSADKSSKIIIDEQVVLKDKVVPATLKTVQISQIVEPAIKNNSDSEKSETKSEPQKKKSEVITPVVNITPEISEPLQVVSKKQRDFTPREKSLQAYTDATTQYNKGNRQQAKEFLKEAIAYNSMNINAYSLLAVIYLEDGRADLASEVTEKGLSNYQNDQALLRLHLQTLVQQSKYEAAIIVMEKRLRLTSPEDLGYLAGLYQKQSDHLNAVKFYSRALQLKPSNSLWWMGQGIALEGMEQYQEAMQSYQRSISTGQLSGKLAEYALSRINTIKQHHTDVVS